MNHTSHIALHLPDHRILYTGLNRLDADRAAARARGEGFAVISAAKHVSGSGRKLWHYTIIRSGRA